jgi:hypothetical protein
MSHRPNKPPAAASKNLHKIPPPRWIPPGVDFYSFPPEIQSAIVDIVNPVYKQLVADAADCLEKSTGLTIVYLLWMEIINQHQLGQQYRTDPMLCTLGDYRDTFNQQLQLVDSKAKTSFVLVRLRELRQNHVLSTYPLALPAASTDIVTAFPDHDPPLIPGKVANQDF